MLPLTKEELEVRRDAVDETIAAYHGLLVDALADVFVARGFHMNLKIGQKLYVSFIPSNSSRVYTVLHIHDKRGKGMGKMPDPYFLVELNSMVFDLYFSKPWANSSLSFYLYYDGIVEYSL